MCSTIEHMAEGIFYINLDQLEYPWQMKARPLGDSPPQLHSRMPCSSTEDSCNQIEYA